ncbi:5'-3' exoribonuclease, partial [Thraustotheca clavata]
VTMSSFQYSPSSWLIQIAYYDYIGPLPSLTFASSFDASVSANYYPVQSYEVVPLDSNVYGFPYLTNPPGVVIYPNWYKYPDGKNDSYFNYKFDFNGTSNTDSKTFCDICQGYLAGFCYFDLNCFALYNVYQEAVVNTIKGLNPNTSIGEAIDISSTIPNSVPMYASTAPSSKLPFALYYSCISFYQCPLIASDSPKKAILSTTNEVHVVNVRNTSAIFDATISYPAFNVSMAVSNNKTMLNMSLQTQWNASLEPSVDFNCDAYSCYYIFTFPNLVVPIPLPVVSTNGSTTATATRVQQATQSLVIQPANQSSTNRQNANTAYLFLMLVLATQDAIRLSIVGSPQQQLDLISITTTSKSLGLLILWAIFANQTFNSIRLYNVAIKCLVSNSCPVAPDLSLTANLQTVLSNHITVPRINSQNYNLKINAPGSTNVTLQVTLLNQIVNIPNVLNTSDMYNIANQIQTILPDGNVYVYQYYINSTQWGLQFYYNNYIGSMPVVIPLGFSYNTEQSYWWNPNFAYQLIAGGDDAYGFPYYSSYASTYWGTTASLSMNQIQNGCRTCQFKMHQCTSDSICAEVSSCIANATLPSFTQLLSQPLQSSVEYTKVFQDCTNNFAVYNWQKFADALSCYGAFDCPILSSSSPSTGLRMVIPYSSAASQKIQLGLNNTNFQVNIHFSTSNMYLGYLAGISPSNSSAQLANAVNLLFTNVANVSVTSWRDTATWYIGLTYENYYAPLPWVWIQGYDNYTRYDQISRKFASVQRREEREEMGVPAFYRWVSEKYPKTVVYAKEEQPHKIEGRLRFNLIDINGENPNGMEFDNLYIDMNGIIHPCSHPEHGEQPKTEEEMYIRLMDYVDRLVACVRPRRLLYMAIDGVAPRAKMNQQRSRRFRSAQDAKERLEIEEEAREYMKLMGHEIPPKTTPWDSNVITPGTKFMAKLAKFMRFYVRDRINSCPAWKDIKVLFSDASVPGEGEHKLMGYIRNQRSQPDYDPNIHHVLHGLDADLIMLGLATHEVKFSILREEVIFGKPKFAADRASVKLDANGSFDTEKRKRGEHGEHDSSEVASTLKPFQFLHIFVLREYLKIEFEPVAHTLPFEYDFERIIDDFVFLCFFVGNDFLPHLPCLDIREGALDYLLLVYAKFLPSLGGYLTNPGGDIDLSRVDVILAEIGSLEDTIFQRRMAKEREKAMRQAQTLTYYQREKIQAAAGRDDAVSVKRQKGPDGKIIEPTTTPTPKDPYSNLKPAEAIRKRIKEKEDAKIEKYKQEIEDVVKLGEPGWKTRYYEDKLKAHDIAVGGGRELVYKTYIEGLCWVMKYYYTGCASWQWFYPFHYAPFASDLKNIDQYSVEFDEGQPFCPFEQLMGVFPADSKHAIPKPYQWLMTDPESPIIDFYPTEIPLDPNGKHLPWLWIALLPFIDEKRLLEAMAPINAKLTDAEKKRNARYGTELIFFHSSIEQPLPTPENSVTQLVVSSFQMSGSIGYHEPSDFPEGCTVPSPEKAKVELMDLVNNKCLSFEFIAPPKKPHLSKILPGAIEAEPFLVAQEDRYISVPRLARGAISIVDMAGATPTAVRTRNGVSRQFQPAPGQQGWGTPTHNNILYQPKNNQPGQGPFNSRGTGFGSGFRHEAPGGGYGNNNNYQDRSRSNRPYSHADNRGGGYNQGGQRGGYNGGRPNDYQRPERSYNQSGYGGPPSQGSGFGPRQPSSAGSGFDPRPTNTGFGPRPSAPPTVGAPPNMDALKMGLRNMHAQRGTFDKSRQSSYPNQRYDR